MTADFQQTGSSSPAPTAPVPPVPAVPAQAGGPTGAAAPAPQVNQTASEAAREAAIAVREALQEVRQNQAGEAVIVQPPPYRQSDIPPEVVPILEVVFGSLVAIILGYPIIRLIARLIERRSDRSLVRGDEVQRQMQQLQQSVDAMAIELERIGEGQRFQAKLLSERAERAGIPVEGQER